MKYEEFWPFVENECLKETMYDDSEGRKIVVIQLIDLWVLANKFKQKEKANEATGTTKED